MHTEFKVRGKPEPAFVVTARTVDGLPYAPYLSQNSTTGGEAVLEFKRLVPEAIGIEVRPWIESDGWQGPSV